MKLALLIICLLCATAAGANPFVDAVVSYIPGPGQFVNDPRYNDPDRCKGAPMGLYVDEPNNDSVVTLGDGGSVTLEFNEPVYDDPRNPYGLDFIVFSNATFVGGNPACRWQELAYVEISQEGKDDSDWFLILPSILPQQLVGGVDTGQSRTVVSGYAEYTPTVGLPQNLEFPSFPVSRTNEELYTVPDRPSVPGNPGTIAFDYVSGGGDAMDIANAVVQSSPGVPKLDSRGQPIPANISWFKYVRLTDAVVGDKVGNYNEISAEIDAVSAVRPALTVGETKALPEGGYALIVGAIVTAAFEGEFYIEAPDRSAALKVISDAAIEAGDRVTITGHISKSGGEFSLPDPMFTVTSSGADLPRPLGMSIGSLASDMAYGLLVRAWGKVTDEGDGYYCIISDGASGVRVECAEYFQVSRGSYVSVTGICDRAPGTGKAVIRPIFSDDITTHSDW